MTRTLVIDALLILTLGHLATAVNGCLCPVHPRTVTAAGLLYGHLHPPRPDPYCLLILMTPVLTAVFFNAPLVFRSWLWARLHLGKRVTPLCP